MKVIFLDIDGVLNTSNTFKEIYFEYKKTGERRIAIDEFRLKILKEIIDLKQAKIVLSSTWRSCLKKENDSIIAIDSRGEDLINIFSKYGLEIYDITPFDENRHRGNEISLWLNQNDDIDTFVILDDDIHDLQKFKDKGLIYIKNDCQDFSVYSNGLCESHIEEALKFLNLKQSNYQKNLKIY